MEEVAQQLEQQYEVLPTGKKHVSFSELKDWSECSYRHKLRHVDQINLGTDSPALHFGTSLHSACEFFLKTRVMNPQIAIDSLKTFWQPKIVEGSDNRYTDASLEEAIKDANAILQEVPSWFESKFPNWEFVEAEHYLYEPIESYPHAFKGFIDGIVKCDGPKGKKLHWLIDWKTSNRGWNREKKSDLMTRSQLVFYKNFWVKKVDGDMKDTRCAFILLKRSAKKDNHCEMVTVSVGDVTLKKSLKVINNMLSSVRRGVAIKNKYSCKYCDYKDTQWCT